MLMNTSEAKDESTYIRTGTLSECELRRSMSLVRSEVI